MQEVEQVAALGRGRVVVVGDVMLDHYVFGAVDRVSAEAPVPVLHVMRERWTLGGAANVAANVTALGGTAHLIGLVGEDEDAHRLRDLLATHGLTDPALATDAGRPTALKTRYLSGQQQMIRVDRESAAPAPADAAQAMVAAARAALAEGGVLVLSDYGKGVLSDAVLNALFDLARERRATVIVDPKRTDYAAYRGAAYITPNRKELTAATGLACETDEQASAAAAAATAASGAAILLTRSEKGMSLFRPDVPPVHLATMARQVFDVSGAGDTVVATLALGLSAGLAPEAAMRLANAAAGVVVAKAGTATPTPGELIAELGGSARRQTLESQGLLDLDQARALRAEWARQGLTVGFANGCFDLIHPGHVSLLAQASAVCDRLVVALNTDASVGRLKGPSRPIQPLDARARVMAAIKGVDAVVAFDEDTPLNLIAALQPDVLVKGADYREDQVVGADIVKARGGKVVLADLIVGQSTTRIAAKAQG